MVASLEQALDHHVSSRGSVHVDATVIRQSCEEGGIQSSQLSQFEAPMLEESVISPPKDEILSKPTQNLASLTRRKDLHSRGQDYAAVQKQLWGWPWKAVWNRGKKQKAEELFFKGLPLYGYETLAKATRNFDPENILGDRYYGTVCKGILSNGQEIAVKWLSNTSHEGTEKFMNEVEVMSKLQHHNLVRLLGCCVERKEKLLVNEYIPNGGLDAYLFDSEKRDLLDWNRRTIIIEENARGLLYLHQDSRLNIIHRDLKASNILLDKELNPKISGFDSAMINISNQEQTSQIVGTLGYMAPEYAFQGLFSEKSDTYSYGVLLLEIISGKGCRNFGDSTNYLGLIEWAWKLWKEDETKKLVDQAILCPGIEMEILRYVHAGLLCVQQSAMDRPDMSTLLSMLKNDIVELPWPKLPVHTARLGLFDRESSGRHGGSDIGVNSMTF